MFEGLMKEALTMGFAANVAIGVLLVFVFILTICCGFLLKYIVGTPERMQGAMEKNNAQQTDLVKNAKEAMDAAVRENVKNFAAQEKLHAQEISFNSANHDSVMRVKDADITRAYDLVRETVSKYTELVTTLSEGEDATVKLIETQMGYFKQVTDSIASLYAAVRTDHAQQYNYMEMHLTNIEALIAALSQCCGEGDKTITQAVDKLVSSITDLRLDLAKTRPATA